MTERMTERMTKSPPQMSPEPTMVVATGLLVLLATVWLGAETSSFISVGRPLGARPAEVFRAAIRLPANLENPRGAWPLSLQRHVANAPTYWTMTGGSAVAACLGLFAMRNLLRGQPLGSARRTRMGESTTERLASVRDLASIRVHGPQPGRLILGRVHGRLVATEDQRHSPTRTLFGRRHARQGDRSAVAVIGPSRCGKTQNIITAILDWQGPMIASSVKTDLLGATLEARQAKGEVRVFDPGAISGMAPSGWTPLRGAIDTSGAMRAAATLKGGVARAGAENMDFFADQAERLLWPLLFVAANTDSTITDVVRWVATQDAPPEPSPTGGIPLGPDGCPEVGEVAALLEELQQREITGATRASETLRGVWGLDERTRSSIYATANLMVGAWSDPTVEASAQSCDIDLNWLLSGNNTLYVCTDLADTNRLQPVISGALNDLIRQAYLEANRTGEPIEPTLLVLDEAGNTPLDQLPEYASTCSGIGLLLVTIWQSKAQIEKHYGIQCDSLLTNHGTKIIFSGTSDVATLDYVDSLIGEEDVLHRTATSETGAGPRRRTVNQSTQPTKLLPKQLLRRVKPGHALLFHGTLPPAHLVTRNLFSRRDRRNHSPAKERLIP